MAAGPLVRRAMAAGEIQHPLGDQAQHQGQQGLQGRHARGGAGEGRQLGVGLVGLVIGTDGVDQAGAHGVPQGVAIGQGAQGRVAGGTGC